MQGVTVLYSSGDYGVAGNGGQCCTKPMCAGGTYNTGGSGTFNPSFPGTWYVQWRALHLLMSIAKANFKIYAVPMSPP